MCLCIYIHTFTYVWLKYISNVGILWRNWVSGIDIVGASTLFKDVRFPFVREKGYSYAGHIMPTPNSRVYSQCWLLTIVIMPSSHKRDTLMDCYSNNNNTICHRENNRNILSYNSRMERQCFFYGSKTFFQWRLGPTICSNKLGCEDLNLTECPQLLIRVQESLEYQILNNSNR